MTYAGPSPLHFLGALVLGGIVLAVVWDLSETAGMALGAVLILGALLYDPQAPTQIETLFTQGSAAAFGQPPQA